MASESSASVVSAVATAEGAIAAVAVLLKTGHAFQWRAMGDFVLPDTEISTAINVARYAARDSDWWEEQLGGHSNSSNRIEVATLVDQWVEFARLHLLLPSSSSSSSPDAGARVAAALETLNAHLLLRSYVVGYALTLADIVLVDALRASPVWNRAVKGKDIAKYPNIRRWFDFVSLDADLQRAVQLVEEQRSSLKQKKDQGSFDIKLKGAVAGQVVTRFPPEPSGYLHIGHAKAALLNDYFAREYEGKLIVRFDDTNPSKEKGEFEESILHDLELLHIKGDILSHTSDSFDKCLVYAEQMIRDGWAYCDDTVQEQMRSERMDGLASTHRDDSVEDNLKHFEEMKKGTPEGLRWCLRAKMSVDAKNKALRDPVMYRCNLEPHNRTGTKYKVYPTYDFACPIVDSTEGVSHVLRTTEYHDRNDQYMWFLEKLDLRKPEIWDYSRMNFVKTLLSKRKLAWFVDNGHVTGWDDPRFPTIRGILRRGLTVAALKQYVLMQGASKNTLLLEWDKLWALNRAIIDPSSPRYTALDSDRCVRVTLDGPKESYVKEVAKHKKNPDLGNKSVTYASSVWIEGDDAKEIQPGEEVTLMDWGNVIVTDIHRDEGTDRITGLDAKLHLEGDFKKTKKKLTWLADIPDLVPLTLIDYDFLITKKKIEDKEEFKDFLNPATEFHIQAKGDPALATLQKGDVVQLERRGFFIVDSVAPLVMLEIPDGKNKTVCNGTPVPASSK